jgi:acetyl esterase/lipase
MKILLMAIVFAVSVSALEAQDASLAWAARLENDYRIIPNVTYLTASNWEAKLDLFVTRTPDKPRPTLIFFHGGGWTGGTKEQRDLVILPYLDMGMNVVNVEYRLARVAQAPAAVEDCRCALRFVIQRAKEYGIDVSRIVVAGDSAGGHLALTTGMLPATAGLDRQCPGPDNLKVAAIVNWYGISDVNELLEGPNMKAYAVTWLGSAQDREQIARRVSPLTYVRAGLPPVLTIHGDADPTVPYTQSVRLHKALAGAGVTNELMTVPGGKHGFDCCTLTQRSAAYAKIREFLTRAHVLGSPAPCVCSAPSAPNNRRRAPATSPRSTSSSTGSKS